MEEIDVLYSQQKIEEVEQLLIQKIDELKQENQTLQAISLINELIGIYREKGDKQKGTKYCEEVLNLFKENNLKNDANYGTTLLNVATANRSFGNYELSKSYYDECMEIYDSEIDENDYRYASLYNNLSLLSIELGDMQESINYLEKSLKILENHKGVEVQIATANTTLSQIYLNVNNLEKAQEHINIATSVFDDFEDYHYSATLATSAQIQYLMKNFEKSAELYKKAMSEIEKYVGKSENYKILEKNLNSVLEHIKPKGLQISKEFYREFGEKMIKEKFSAYESKIAVGLVGQGSECFGFDDELSKDHDFGAGFCLWVTDEVYSEIGEQLQVEYDKLPKEYKGIKRISTHNTNKRVGIFKIKEFYKSLIMFEDVPITNDEWLYLEDYQLAQATNGEIFRDDLGEFTRIREGLLKYYPVEVLAKKIVNKAHLVSQTGQYNFERVLKRGDLVTSSIILSDFIMNVMQLGFLLNRKYAPFYKWTYKSFCELDILSGISRSISKLQGLYANINNNNDNIAIDDILNTIEKIVSEIIKELRKQGFIKLGDNENFLDFYLDEIASLNLKSGEILGEKIELVKKIVVAEWNAFDSVNGMDGRATCQDDFTTFNIMRSSQFLAWSNELLRSYAFDFEYANKIGRNIITEKYAFMMKSTDFENYKLMEEHLPKISDEKNNLIEIIVEQQLDLMEQLKVKYPKLVSNARSLRATEDSEYNTSYETYLRGELCTYSMRTVRLYHDFIQNNNRLGINTARLYLENTAKLYGYKDIETAESKL